MKHKLITAILFSAMCLNTQASEVITLFQGLDHKPQSIQFVKSNLFKNLVQAQSTWSEENCSDELCGSDVNYSRVIDGLTKKKGIIYNTGEPCIKVNFFKADQFLNGCSLEIQDRSVCLKWYKEGDCIEATTVYDVFLFLN